MPLIETVPIADAHEFLEYLRRSNPLWRCDEKNDEYRGGWIFRGQRRATWPLQPSVFRDTVNHENELVRQVRNRISRDFGHEDWAAWARPDATAGAYEPAALAEVACDALTHAAIVQRFAGLAFAARHPIIIGQLLWHLENPKQDSLSRIFNGEARPERSPEQFAPFAIAQHHGLPTPLLDWTYNPMVAAYFAAERAETEQAAEDNEIAVWALRESLFRDEWCLRRYSLPAGITPFLDAQEGLFTWCPTAYLIRLRSGAYPTITGLVEAHADDLHLRLLPRPLIRKVTLPHSAAPQLMKLLWRERMTPAHLMPTFDHIKSAVEMEARWGGPSRPSAEDAGPSPL